MRQQDKPAVLHITDGDRKFIPQLIDLFGKYFELGLQEFIVMSRDEKRMLDGHRFLHLKDSRSVRELGHHAIQFDAVVLHGLNDFRLVQALMKANLELSKCYWIAWGGDLYCYRNNPWSPRTWYRNWVRKSFVRRIGHILTFVRGEVELARKWYGFRGEYHECLCYLSNTIQWEDTLHSSSQEDGDGWSIVVGHSGYDTNLHFEIFDRLREQVPGGLGKIYCPLSYGNSSYIEKVVSKGTEYFGDRFVALLDFLEFDKYLAVLASVDAGIYAHRRQQAMGNCVALLGLGKKVFLRTNLTQWDTLSGLGLKLFDCTELSSAPLESAVRDRNIRIAREYFSEENLVRQYAGIFNSISRSQQ